MARQLAPNSLVAGKATVFVFPDLNTGNTTHKAVQRSADCVSLGPMLQGLQDKAFVEFVRTGQFPAHAATAWDGYCATRVAEAGVQALSEGRRVSLPALDTPPLYLPREGASR